MSPLTHVVPDVYRERALIDDVHANLAAFTTAMREFSTHDSNGDIDLAAMAVRRVRVFVDRACVSLDALLQTDLFDRLRQVEDSEAQRLERAISEVGQLGVVHDPRRSVGLLGSLLGKSDRVSVDDESSPSVDGRELVTPDAVAKTVGETTDTRSFGRDGESAGGAKNPPALADGGGIV